MPVLTLNDFRGGINNWAEPYAIEATQAVDLLDTDISSGAIKAWQASVAVTDQPAHLAYRTASRSVAKFGENYFWSDNTNGGLGSSLGYVGVTPPSTLPSVTFGVRGTRFTGSYKYVATFETAVGVESAPCPVAGVDGLFFTTINATRETRNLISADYPAYSAIHPFQPYFYGYHAGDRVTFNGYDYECVQDFTYYTGYGALPATYEPGASETYWKDISTYTISSDGYDSLVVTLPTPSDAAITYINLYRTASDDTDFYLVAQLPRGTTEHTDTLPDTDLLLQSALATADSHKPPTDAKYLSELNEVFYCASGTKVYISDQSNPHGWNPLLFVTYPDTVTGISSDKDGLLVFTANRTYRLTGSTLADIVTIDLQVDQGCPNWRTIAAFRNYPVWCSNDGVCIYSGVANQEGKYVTVVTENIYEFTSAPDHAVTSNGVYWTFTSSGAVCFDLRSGGRIYRRSVTADRAWYDADNDRLLVEVSGVWYQTDSGANQTWEYTSPDLSGGDLLVNKMWRRVFVNIDTTATLSVYLDGTLAQTFSITGGGIEKRFFPRGSRGTWIQVKVSSTGTLRSIGLEYTALTGDR